MTHIESKNDLVIKNERFFKKYFPNIGELALLSNLRIDMERGIGPNTIF